MPPSASAKKPRRAPWAPVKAPRAWPKSSASASSAGMAAQLKRTRGRLDRRLSAWRSDATSSLPVPVSPRTSTVTSLPATRATASSSRRMGALVPTMRLPIACSAASIRVALRSARASSARSTTATSSSMSKGLVA